ncbi:MAG: ArnT family glycosyltransferase [Desulfurivibrionaceae bacterium]
MKNYSWPSLLPAICFSLIVPVLLYHFRALDNNSLCRWEWVFRDGPPLLLYGVTLVTAGAALFLSILAWPENKPLFLGGIAFLAGISLWGEPELIMDASRYFSQAKYLEIHGIRAFWQGWGGEISAWTDLPLIPFLYGLVFAGLGEARIFIQILTTSFFVGAVLLTYLYAKDLRDEETGVLAGLLLLCHPYLLLQIPLMMVDLPTMFFLILTLYTFSRALRDGGRRSIALAAVAVFLLFWTKYSAWLLLTVLPVIVLARSPADYKKAGWAALKVMALAVLFSLPLFIGLWEVVWAQLKLLVEYQRPGLSRWSEGFISTFFFQTHPLVSIAALFSLGIGLYKKDK